MVPSISEVEPKPGTCFVCGCTEERPCQGGCSWVDQETCQVCSVCHGILGELAIEFLLFEVVGAPSQRPEPSGLVLP